MFVYHGRSRNATIWSNLPSDSKNLVKSSSKERLRAPRGILDSYRQSAAGKKAAADAAAGQSALDKQNMLLFESVDEDTCPAECVEEVITPQDFKRKCMWLRIMIGKRGKRDPVFGSSTLSCYLLHTPKEEAGDALVVLDLYKTSCGACKYLMPGFVKLCKSSYSSDENAVVFLKHNVFDDEEEELTDLARRLRGVPKFLLFRNMVLLEEFSTRDRQQLEEAIAKHVQ